MFYDARTNQHGLKHDPLKALVVPRPIGWISTLSRDGVANLAPYSFFNLFATDPAVVMFGCYMGKDSQPNAEATGEFVCNLATWELRNEMNASSATLPPHVSEFETAGIEMAPSVLVKPPRVRDSPVHLECVYLETLTLNTKSGPHSSYGIVVGEVVGIHIDDAFIRNGMVDTAAMKPLARLGYHDYAVVDEVFSMRRPD
jgi:flavin reductase (DIM6/NTAB) family NADH-FMN oxidoreductase RutF